MKLDDLYFLIRDKAGQNKVLFFMATIPTLLNSLQAISIEHPAVFAVIVILVMLTEGLMLVGLINLLLKIISRLTPKPSDRA